MIGHFTETLVDIIAETFQSFTDFVRNMIETFLNFFLRSIRVRLCKLLNALETLLRLLTNSPESLVDFTREAVSSGFFPLGRQWSFWWHGCRDGTNARNHLITSWCLILIQRIKSELTPQSSLKCSASHRSSRR